MDNDRDKADGQEPDDRRIGESVAEQVVEVQKERASISGATTSAIAIRPTRVHSQRAVTESPTLPASGSLPFLVQQPAAACGISLGTPSRDGRVDAPDRSNDRRAEWRNNLPELGRAQ